MADSTRPTVFTVAIILGNDAMQTPEDVAGLLRDMAAYMLKHGSWPRRVLYDVNGNDVGTVEVT